MSAPQARHEQVEWEQARAANRANWDDRASVHEQAYGLEDFDDPAHLSTVVTDDLPVLAQHLPDGGIRGLDVVHLQCHIGTDTLSLARAGARVTALDLSPASLSVARRLAARAGADIRFVEGDVLDAAALVGGEHDVVYTSIGTITWLPDLDRWARQVASLLRPGGVFFIRDGHPMLYALDDAADGLVVRYPYLRTGAAIAWDDAGTYVGDGQVEHTRSYEWPHPLSEIVAALLSSGLVLERLDEGDHLPWRFAPRMAEDSPGRFVWPQHERSLVPCTFTVVARRPV